MLKIMPKNEMTRNVIIAIICLLMAAYVLVGFGSAPATAPENKIASVGEVNLKVRDIQMAKQQYQQFLNQPTSLPFVVGAVFDRAILQDGAARNGVVVSDNELRDVIIANRTSSDGSFMDEEEWANGVRRQYRMQVPTFERYMRNNMLVTDKFRSLFLDSTYVGEEEISDRFREESQKVVFEMVMLTTSDVKDQLKLDDDAAIQKVFNENTDKFMTGPQRQIQFVMFDVNQRTGTIELSDEDLKNYYAANQSRYMMQEQVKASHVLIKTDKHTDEEALALARKALDEIKGGADIADVAGKYSEDEGSRGTGGDLGFFQRGRMVKPFEDAAFGLEIGQVSEPVKTQFGYHIIQKKDHQAAGVKPFDEVKASIRAILGRERAKEELLAQAETFRTKALETNFSETAQAMSFDIHVSDPFDNDNQASLGEKLNINYQVRTAAFALEKQNDLTPVIDAGTNIVVAQYIDDVPARTLDFEKDKARVKAMAEQVAGIAFLTRELSSIREAAEKAPEKSLLEAAGTRAYMKDNHYLASVEATSRNIPWQIRREGMDFEKDLYSLEPGQFLDGLETSTDSRLVLARVKSKEDADMSKLEEKRFEIAENLRRERGGELLSDYIYTRRLALDPNGTEKARLTAAFERR